MSRPIVNTGGPGMVAASARLFSIVAVVIAFAVLMIFVGLNHGLKDNDAGASTTGSMTAPAAQPT